MKIFSLRSFIIYANFLFLPIILTFLWLLLPLNSYTAYSGVSMVYYVVMFFTWISFYDLNLPGCSKIQIIFFFLLYIGMCIGWLSVVSDISKESNRLAYSFIDASVIIFCAVCYFIYVVIHKIKKTWIYKDDTIVDEKGKRRTKRRIDAWTKTISKLLCYYKKIDIDASDQFRTVSLTQNGTDDTVRDDGSRARPKSLKQVLFVQKLINNRDTGDARTMAEMEADGGNGPQAHSIEMGVKSSNQDIELHRSKDDNAHTESSSVVSHIENKEFVELMPKYEISYRNFFLTVLYQFFVVLTWFWLHNFSILIRDKDLFRSPGWALFSIIVFQASRVILMGISNVLNRLLKPKEIQFFTFFQFPLMFFLYYRNLFLNTSSWAITVLVSLVLFLIDVIYYPLHMTKRYWEFRHVHLVEWMDKKKTNSGFFAFVRKALDDENPSYDRHVMKLSIEYYYDKMAEYISIITMVTFISLIRALSYKIEYYPTFEALTHEKYIQLLYRYLYLILFEVSYDLAVRALARHFLKVDISNRGRNETIANYCTRFIFTLFVLYDLMDVYQIQVVYQDSFSSSSLASSMASSASG